MSPKTSQAIELINKYTQVKVIEKSSSGLHKAINWVLTKLGNKIYMEYTWTTIGQTIARPSCADLIDSEWKVMFHEGVHAIDSKKMGNALYGFLYLMPQSLVPVFVLGALLGSAFSLSWLWLLLGIVFALPIASLGRGYFEARAYAMSMSIEYWTKGADAALREIEEYVDVFKGKTYYYMFPFSGVLRKYFLGQLERVKRGELTPYQRDCRDFALKNAS